MKTPDVISNTIIPDSVVTLPIPTQLVSITPEMMEQVKLKLKEDKLAEQKKKKRDYQREYMRKYKKDEPVSAEDKLKRKVKRSLGKIEPYKLKPILTELLGNI
jgi:hypothetical protein